MKRNVKSDLKRIIKRVILESKKHKQTLYRLRRLEELKDNIEFQTTIHHPCEFEDGEEYADFCINEGLSFFYGDEGYNDDEEYEKNYDITDTQEERIEVEKLMYEEYYDKFIELWNDSGC